MSSHYPGYAYLGSYRWIRRDQIPNSLLEKYDAQFALAESNPNAIDPVTNRSYGSLWLDTVDEILGLSTPLLNRDALLKDKKLHNKAARRALDVMVGPRPPTRP